MAKQYKVRKKCLICKKIFYPSYAGSLYCNECKSKKSNNGKKKAKTPRAKKKPAPVKVAKRNTVKRTSKKKK
ncbi:hypothetical protein JXB41_02920 [Candidatus Woesearchaeota archaeon]|nr:hypothetical protein [Candidatus Woesearchaeota archaeon]